MMKRNKAVIFSLVFSIVITMSAVRDARSQAESCVTGKCHAEMGKGKSVHNPVKEGMCTTCHQAADDQTKKAKHPGNLTITLVQQGAELCYMCHEPKNKKKIVHAPIMGGDCTSCHNPHQSPNKGMLKEAMPKICFQCHPDNMKHSVMHPPVAGGDCSGCHDNHQSDFSSRLIENGNALCFMCHPDKEEGLKTKKNAHPPVKQSCVLCHNPHGSANKAMLVSSVPTVCSNCHPNQPMLAQKATVKHGPMIDSKTCMNCHDPHFADFPALLPKAQADLCLTCHDREMTVEKGKIMNMKAYLETYKNGHGPVKQGLCASCHNPHGSDYWRILLKYYPPEFYTSYADGKYALCFSCHDKGAFAELAAGKTTNFRDGNKNLHFVHVNKNAKGRTCRACHEVHADSGRPSHVNDSINFGNWSMPINFNPGKNGGTCAPGCHGEKRYSR